jgi:hypothetical protein
VSKRLIDVVIARWIVNFIRYGEGEGEGEGEMERERKVLGPGWAESLFFLALALVLACTGRALRVWLA